MGSRLKTIRNGAAAASVATSGSGSHPMPSGAASAWFVLLLAAKPGSLGCLVSYWPLASRDLAESRAQRFASAGPRPRIHRLWPRDAPVVSDPRESARGELLKFVALRGAWRARIDIMYSPPPDEAAEALARDPIDPVEATERFLEDAAADTDPPGKDEIL